MKLAVIKPATLEQAKRMTDALRRDYLAIKSSWFDMGKKADRALRAEVPKALGLNVNQWISQWASDEEEGRSTIFDSVKIIRALAKLPEATVRSLPKGNALELTKLPECKRLDWVRNAQRMSTRDFKVAVREATFGKAKVAQDDEQEFRTLRVKSLPRETYDQIIDFRNRMAKLAGCDPEEKPGVPWGLIGAYLQMVEDSELLAFYEGISERLKAS